MEVCADGEYDDPVGLCMALDVWQVDAECAPVVAAWVGASMDTPAITAAFKELSDACTGVPDEVCTHSGQRLRRNHCDVSQTSNHDNFCLVRSNLADRYTLD